MVLSHVWFSRLQKMLLVLQKSVFIEKKAAQQCVTMRERIRPLMATIWIEAFDKIVVL